MKVRKKVRSGEDSPPKMEVAVKPVYKGVAFELCDDRYKVDLIDNPPKVTLLVEDLFTRMIEEEVTAELFQSGSMESVVEVHGRLVGESKSHVFISQHNYYDGQMFVFGIPKGCVIKGLGPEHQKKIKK